MQKIPDELQKIFGYTDDQVANLKENQSQFIQKLPELIKYKLVAEVVESKNCGWGAKTGDRIVMCKGANIAINECTNKEELCLWALAPLLPFTYIFMELIASGIDPTKKLIIRRVGCLDTGVEQCGWGKIVMEVKAERIE